MSGTRRPRRKVLGAAAAGVALLAVAWSRRSRKPAVPGSFVAGGEPLASEGDIIDQRTSVMGGEPVDAPSTDPEAGEADRLEQAVRVVPARPVGNPPDDPEAPPADASEQTRP